MSFLDFCKGIFNLLLLVFFIFVGAPLMYKFSLDLGKCLREIFWKKEIKYKSKRH